MIARRHTPLLAAAIAAIAVLCWSAFAARSARGAEAPAIWHIDAQPAPTVLQPGHTALITLNVLDIGAGAVRPPATFTDLVPGALKVQGITFQAPFHEFRNIGPCAATPQTGGATLVGCTYEPPPPETGRQMPAFESFEVRISVAVEATTGPLPNVARVEGGGASKAAEDTRPLAVGDEATPFGIERYTLSPEAQDGSPVEQAGSHPFQLTTDLGLDETLGTEAGPLLPAAPELLRDVQVTLPPGLLGDPSATPQCTDRELSTIFHNIDRCPQNSVIGVANVTLFEPTTFKYTHRSVPVFNVTPAPASRRGSASRS